jgi:plastocyanin
VRPRPPAVVLFSLSFAALAASSCGAAPEPARTVAANRREVSAAAGRIWGTVRLQGNPPARASQPVPKDHDICGREVPVTRIALGLHGGVRHAFVYLENAPASQPLRARETVPVEQSRCEYVPHAIQIPAGTKLDIVNGDPILHNVHARQMTADGLRTIFNIAQPMRGQRTVVDLPLTKPGIVALTCEAGHPWMTAYILVADHSYTAVTGDDGGFVIEGVPAGTYRIRMWHEGVRLTNILASLQRYEYEAPYEITREVVVPEAGDAEVNFDLELRGSDGSVS